MQLQMISFCGGLCTCEISEVMLRCMFSLILMRTEGLGLTDFVKRLLKEPLLFFKRWEEVESFTILTSTVGQG